MFSNPCRQISSGLTALITIFIFCMALSSGTAYPALADTSVSCGISPSTLPDGTVGIDYSATLQAGGGTQPYTWTVVGGALPAGLTLGGATGVISGTPSAAQICSLIVRADDNAQHYCTLSVSIEIKRNWTAENLTPIQTLMISNTDNFLLSSGVLPAAKELTSSDGRVKLSLPAGSAINMQSSTQLGAATESNPPTSTDGSTPVRAYSFMPSGATFSPAATMTLRYETGSLPAGAAESGLYIAYWNGTAWEKLISTVNTATKEVSASVSHFTVFAIRYMPPTTTTVTTPAATTTTTSATANITTSAATSTTTATPTVAANVLGTFRSFSMSSGTVPSAVSLSSSNGKMVISLADNATVGLPSGSQQITAIQLATTPAPPAGSKVIEAYAFGPDNTIFNPAASVTLKYDPANLPADVQEADLYVALLENSDWTEVPSAVDTKAKTVTAQISHFSTYALLGRVTAEPVAPVTPVTPTAPITPAAPAETPAATPAVAGSGAPSDMAVPVLIVIIAGGLMVIVLVITFIMRRRSPG